MGRIDMPTSPTVVLVRGVGSGATAMSLALGDLEAAVIRMYLTVRV